MATTFQNQLPIWSHHHCLLTYLIWYLIVVFFVWSCQLSNKYGIQLSMCCVSAAILTNKHGCLVLNCSYVTNGSITNIIYNALFTCVISVFCLLVSWNILSSSQTQWEDLLNVFHSAKDHTPALFFNQFDNWLTGWWPVKFRGQFEVKLVHFQKFVDCTIDKL